MGREKYLHGRSDEGVRLLFKFRSGTHGLNEVSVIEMVELNVRCVVLSARVQFVCCGSVLLIGIFLETLKQLLGARYAEFKRLSTVEKTCENWEANFDTLLHLVCEGVHRSCMGSVKTKIIR